MTLFQKNESMFKDVCPGTTTNIDCTAVGGLIQITDAFYGISNATPSVCVYK